MDTIMIVKIFSFSDKMQYRGGDAFSTELSGSFFSVDAMVNNDHHAVPADEQLQWYVVLLTRAFYTPTPAAFQTAPCVIITDCMEKGKYIYIHIRTELGITLCMHSLRVLAHARRAILPISIPWLFHQLL